MGERYASMIKAAIFDFDGTLANTLPDLCSSINRMRAHFGYEPVTVDDVLRAVNNATPRFIRLSLPEDFDESHMDEATEAYFASYDVHYLDETVPYDGVPEMIAKLKKEGVRLAVMSNKDNTHLREMVEKLFPGLFDTVWGTVEGVPVKPDPARAFLIAEEFGMKPEEFAFIGDSDVDMMTAKNAGMLPVGVSWGYRSAAILSESGAEALANNTDALYDILAAR